MELKIKKDKEQDVIEAFAIVYKYKEEIESEVDGVITQIPNPTSKEDFAQNILNSYIKEVFIASQINDVEIQKQEKLKIAKQEADNLM